MNQQNKEDLIIVRNILIVTVIILIIIGIITYCFKFIPDYELAPITSFDWRDSNIDFWVFRD